MSGSQIADLREKIGSLIATLEAVQDTSLERHKDNRDAMSALGAELRNIKHQDRQHETVITNKVEMLDLGVKTLEMTMLGVQSALEDIRDDLRESGRSTRASLDELKGPVDELVGIRKRVGAYLAVFLSIGTILWFLVQPFYEYVVRSVMHWLHIDI